MILAAAGEDAALAFIEIGAVALLLAVLARVAGRFGITAIPLYLLAGLAVGQGGVAPLELSSDFIELAGEIGVLLLLLTLGLEYTADELRDGLQASVVPGLVDAAANALPGFVAALLLGWDATTAVLLAGVCWISSSGVASKLLTDLDRVGNRETPGVLNLLVLEDLAMAAYLPVVAALVAGRGASATAATVAVALAAVAVILVSALRWGHRLSALLDPSSDESLLLAVFGLTLLVGGLAQRIQVSAAIGAFLVGLALSGPVQERAGDLVRPLRDLFAATFFLFFSFRVDPADLVGVLPAACALAAVGTVGKMLSGGVAALKLGVQGRGRLRAGTTLVARGEFSVVIASLAAGRPHGDDLGALTAGYVLVTVVAGSLLTRFADRVPIPPRLLEHARPH